MELPTQSFHESMHVEFCVERFVANSSPTIFFPCELQIGSLIHNLNAQYPYIFHINTKRTYLYVCRLLVSVGVHDLIQISCQSVFNAIFIMNRWDHP